jgi:hypothetical protein
MKSTTILVTVAITSLSFALVASAAPPCPPEVKEARELLTSKTASAKHAAPPAKSLSGARGQDPQAPRGENVQAPRGENPQAPRGENPQAPRGQDVQAPRAQDRGQDVQAPRNAAKGRTTALANARRLVVEAETSCKDADDQRASANARAAIELLKYLP